MYLKKNHLRNCRICHKLFVDTGLGICQSCYEKEREDEKIVIEYVREHHQASLQEIVEDTGVDARVVSKMIERGQFIMGDNEITHPCKRCGKPIVRGIYCPQCLMLMHRAIDKANARAVAQGYEAHKAISKELGQKQNPLSFVNERTPAARRKGATKTPHRSMNIWRTMDTDRER